MPTKILAHETTIQVEPLTQAAFAAFGTVIQKPPPDVPGISANQGSAVKYPDVSPLISSYDVSKSRFAALPQVSLFSCKPRVLQRDNSGEKIFTVSILERHPYTPQTFIPTGIAKNDHETAYLVIVAPTQPQSAGSSPNLRGSKSQKPPYPVPDRKRKLTLKQRVLGGRPNLFTNDYSLMTTPSNLPTASPISIATATPRGPGLPDLANLRAFLARGDQAVTYGAGTWHSPMVVLGEQEINFVTVQYMNGVGDEDCQEVEWNGGLTQVVIPNSLNQQNAPLRAKL